MSEKLVFDKKIRGSYIICILPLCNYEVDLLALFRIADAQQTEWYDIIETFATTTIHHSRKEMRCTKCK